MAKKGISIHIAAALVIARRGMKYKEIVPPVLSVFLPEKIRRRHHWSHMINSSLIFNIPQHLHLKSVGLKYLQKTGQKAQMFQRWAEWPKLF